MVDDQHLQTQLPGYSGTKQTGRTCTDDNDIKFLHGREFRRWAGADPVRPIAALTEDAVGPRGGLLQSQQALKYIPHHDDTGAGQLLFKNRRLQTIQRGDGVALRRQ